MVGLFNVYHMEFLWITVSLLLGWIYVSSAAVCPHDDPTLVRWSDPQSWNRENGRIPYPNDSVVIYRPVLLDVSPPTLHSIHILKEGRLVFSPRVELSLRVRHIHIEGEMFIGSDHCPFNGRVNITLYGLRDGSARDALSQKFGQKFIGVDAGGSLNIHGMRKRSWTKLGATPNIKKKMELLWDHEAMKKADKRQYRDKIGINVYVFSHEGEVVTFKNYPTNVFRKKFEVQFRMLNKFVNLIRDVKNGHYILVAIRKEFAPKDEDTNGMSLYNDIYEAIEKLMPGERTKLRQFRPGNAYVLFARKGRPAMTREDLANHRQGKAILEHSDEETGLEFVVSSKRGKRGELQYQVKREKGNREKLMLTHDVSTWIPGDRVVIFSTDYDWKQAEEAVIQECTHCKKNEILLDRRLNYNHWGSIVDGVDERAEVALLTRNILIQGEMEEECPLNNENCGKCSFDNPACGKYVYDTFGGHIIITKNFKEARIVGAELYHMGQQTDLGRYPIHYHLVGNVTDNALVRSNSIHHTFSRCVTVHATHHLLVQDNVCYDHLGHGYFIEDGGEKYNVLDGNLGGATRPSNLTLSDPDPATFWITSPLTSLTNNAAAGGVRVGYWFIFPNMPMGPSKDFDLFDWGEAKTTPITMFCNNVAHSYGRAGLFVGNSFANDTHVTSCTSQYTPSEGGMVKEVVLRRFTGYKNIAQNAWIVGGQVRLHRASLADSPIQVFFNDRGEGRQMLTDSILVGETINRGTPRSRNKRQVVKSYRRGVTFNGKLGVDGVWFKEFRGPTSGAISFLTSNIKLGATFKNTKWAFGDGDEKRVFAPYSPMKSKVRTATFVDQDGSVTGTPNTRLLNPTSIVGDSYSCRKEKSWNMAVCSNPDDYAMVFYKFRNGFSSAEQEIMKDGDTARLHRGGGKEGSYLVIKNGTYIIDRWVAFIRQKHLYTEKGLLLETTGLRKGEFLSIGLCMPNDMNFRYPKKRRQVLSVSEVQQERKSLVFYFDETERLLFINFIGQKQGTTQRDARRYAKSTKQPLLVRTPKGASRFMADCRQAASKYRSSDMEETPRDGPPRIGRLRKTDLLPPQGYGAGDTTVTNLIDAA